MAAWVKFQGAMVADARIALAAVQSFPIEVKAAGRALVGKPLDIHSMGDAAEICYVLGKPLDNTDFHMNWRKEMIRKYVIGALTEIASS